MLDAPADKPADQLKPIEDKLAAIWSEVIAFDEIAREDNFFDLGGHSVLMMQVITRIRKALGAELTLRDMFEAPTIAELARVIDQQLSSAAVMKT